MRFYSLQKIAPWQKSHWPKLNVTDAITISMAYYILSLKGQMCFHHM